MNLAPVGIQHYLVLAGLLFSIGLVGVLVRRNALTVLLSIELLLNAANLSFVSFSAYHAELSGQAVVFFTMIVAAAEVTVALAIVVLLFRRRDSDLLEELKSLKW
ncbi:MAG: NADH-quinone oxidoreductase subunit K [Omnitrophica bacterium RIFCSPHIGHO2_02_FULL_63_14]|nr:MAG: NADH-quinone oxidoreductase subunit K [Omnitrophica bacterium RIFCSPHIGHO2_02_FULL_63_14]